MPRETCSRRDPLFPPQTEPPTPRSPPATHPAPPHPQPSPLPTPRGLRAGPYLMKKILPSPQTP